MTEKSGYALMMESAQEHMNEHTAWLSKRMMMGTWKDPLDYPDERLTLDKLQKAMDKVRSPHNQHGRFYGLSGPQLCHEVERLELELAVARKENEAIRGQNRLGQDMDRPTLMDRLDKAEQERDEANRERDVFREMEKDARLELHRSLKARADLISRVERAESMAKKLDAMGSDLVACERYLGTKTFEEVTRAK